MLIFIGNNGIIASKNLSHSYDKDIILWLSPCPYSLGDVFSLLLHTVFLFIDFKIIEKTP